MKHFAMGYQYKFKRNKLRKHDVMQRVESGEWRVESGERRAESEEKK